MGFWDRFRKPVRPKTDNLFKLPAAGVEMHDALKVEFAGKAGVCFRTFETRTFEETESDIMAMLAGNEFGMKYRFERDNYGYSWVVLESKDIDSTVAGVHIVSETLIEAGYQRYILCAVFEFIKNREKIYWIYHFGRGNFYPFASLGGETRDFRLELTLRSILAQSLPVEAMIENWFPLWDVPF